MSHAEKNILHVYDFDDTIVSSTAHVYIRNKFTGNIIQKVSFHALFEYELSHYEEFDLAEFETLPNPEFLPEFDNFVNDIKNLGKDNVAILTARYWDKPIVDVLAGVGIRNIEIKTVGLEEPSPGDREVAAYRKKEWLREQIINRKLDFLMFIDDNEQNIYLAKTLEKEFPKVKFLFKIV